MDDHAKSRPLHQQDTLTLHTQTLTTVEQCANAHKPLQAMEQCTIQVNPRIGMPSMVRHARVETLCVLFGGWRGSRHLCPRETVSSNGSLQRSPCGQAGSVRSLTTSDPTAHTQPRTIVSSGVKGARHGHRTQAYRQARPEQCHRCGKCHRLVMSMTTTMLVPDASVCVCDLTV